VTELIVSHFFPFLW